MDRRQKPASLDSTTRAHLERDIKFLLIPWFSFRAYVQFSGRDRKKGHFYGNEHQVTYNQCLHRKVPAIVLRKEKGYTDLIHFIEHSIKGKFLSAKIYMREPGCQDFNTLCREYYKGGLNSTTLQDPQLAEDEGFNLYYQVKEGRLMILEEDPNAIDFKAEISENLK
jgi:hypothetical protein